MSCDGRRLRGRVRDSCICDRYCCSGDPPRTFIHHHVLGSLRCNCLLELHVVLDGLHAGDGARHLDGGLDVATRAYEAAQLNDPLERLDVDLGDLEAWLAQNGRFDFSGDCTVINVLTRALMGARRRTAESHRENDRRYDCAESFDGMHRMELQCHDILHIVRCRDSHSEAPCVGTPPNTGYENPTMQPRASSHSFIRAHAKLVRKLRRGALRSSGVDSKAARKR